MILYYVLHAILLHFSMEDITVDIKFSGGAELLFNNVKNHEVKIPCPSGSQIMMSDLLVWIRV